MDFELAMPAHFPTQFPLPLNSFDPAGARYVSGGFSGPFLAGYTPLPDSPSVSYGIQRLDHAVGNTHDLLKAVEYIVRFTGEEAE